MTFPPGPKIGLNAALVYTVKGTPLCRTRIVDDRHPPNKAFPNPLVKCDGSSTMLSAVNLLETSKSDNPCCDETSRGLKTVSPLLVPLSLLLISSVDLPNV